MPVKRKKPHTMHWYCSRGRAGQFMIILKFINIDILVGRVISNSQLEQFSNVQSLLAKSAVRN